MNSAWFPTDNPYIVYRIETTILSQSIINNTSTVRVRMFAKRTNAYSPGTQGHGTFYVTINGTEYSEYHNHVDEGVIINSTGIYVFSKTLTIPHNNDGTKTLATAGRINYSRFTATSHSASFTLTPIPRSTFPTFDASSVEMGEDVTITLNAASADYTHDLEWSYNGGAFTLIDEDVESPYSWTVPDLTNYVTDSDRTNIVIRVTTHNGDTVMGQQTGVFSAVVPLDVVPVVNNPTATELTEGIAEQFDAFIQTKSAIRFSLSASGFRGSTIVGYSANFNNANYGGQTFDTPVIEVGGEIPLTVTATDSRGRSATRVIPITVIPFSTPTLSAFSVQRVDQLHNPDDSGDYIAIKLNYNVPSLNGGNTADISIGSRKTVEGGSFTEFYSSSVLSQNTTIYPAQIFSSDYQLDFQIEIDDYFGNKVTATGYVPGGEVVLDIGTDGDRISFFKTSEYEGFEVKNGAPMRVHGQEILDLIQSMIPIEADTGWIDATIASGFQLYSSSAVCQYRKVGKRVYVRGRLTPTSSISGSDAEKTMFTLPTGFRPQSQPIYVLCQGSAQLTWLLTINTNGNVTFSRARYGGTTWATTSAGYWLPFVAEFITDQETEVTE